MTHNDIMAKIREITERGIAYARAHADEIESRTAQDEAESESKIAAILTNAENAVKHSWSVYESFKSQISAAASSSNQYKTAIIKLTRILGV